MMEQSSGTVEKCCWNTVVEQWKSDGGTVLEEQCGGRLQQ